MEVPAVMVFLAFLSVLMYASISGIVLLAVWAIIPASWREAVIDWVDSLPSDESSR